MNIYVDGNNGLDTNTGDITSKLKTLDKQLEIQVDDDVILLNPFATYSIISQFQSLTNKRLTIKSENVYLQTVDFSARTDELYLDGYTNFQYLKCINMGNINSFQTVVYNHCYFIGNGSSYMWSNSPDFSCDYCVFENFNANVVGNSINLGRGNNGNLTFSHNVFINNTYGVTRYDCTNKQQLVKCVFYNSPINTTYVTGDYVVAQSREEIDDFIYTPDNTYGFKFPSLFHAIIEKNNVYYKIVNNELLQTTTQIFSEDLFNEYTENSDIMNYGINNLQGYNFIFKNIDGYKIKINGLLNKYEPIFTKNLLLNNSTKISSILFDYTVSGNINVNMLTSFDNEIWKYYNPVSQEWEIQDINNVINYNTKTELETLFTNYDLINNDLINSELYFQIFVNPSDENATFVLNSIDVSYNNDSTLKIIISTDTDVWKGYNSETSQFINIDINDKNDIYKYGLSITQLNTLNNSNPQIWNNLIDKQKIKFQFYMQINNTSDILQLDNLSLQADILGTWKLQNQYNQTELTGDYLYEYVDNKTLRVKIFSDGSYKIRYNFIDTEQPSDLIDFSCELVSYEGNPAIKLTKVPPYDYDLQGTIIRRKENDYPEDPYGQDGSLFINASDNNIVYDTNNIVENKLYCYTQFPYDIRTPKNINVSLSNYNKTSIQLGYFVPLDGLVQYFPLETNNLQKYDTSYSLLLNNGISFNNGYQSLNGTNQYITIQNSPQMSDWTVSLSMHYFDNGQKYQDIISSSSGLSYLAMIQDGYLGSFSKQFMTEPMINDTLYHILLTGDSQNNEVKYYINGVLKLTISTQPSTLFNWIGCNPGQTGEYLQQNINNFRIYNRILSSNEIFDVYNYDKMS